MCNITMKKETNRDPPKLKSIPNSRIVFILQLKYGTIPSKFILNTFCIAINE